MIDNRELNYAIESNRIFHEFTMDSILNRIINSGNNQINRIDKMQLDYHLKMVGNAYNSFRRLSLDNSMIDRASKAISMNNNSTFNMVTRIPDESEITEIRPRAIVGYVNMIDKSLSDITKGKIDDKKEKKLTSYDEIMKDLGPDLFDGDIIFFRDNCHYNVTTIARTDPARSKSINVDTINYQIIPWIYSFDNTSKKISDMVKDYRLTMEYIRSTIPRVIDTAATLRQQGIQNKLKDNRYSQFAIKATNNLLSIISFLTIMVMRKINSTVEIMNKYTEICRCFLEYTDKEIVVAKEDASTDSEYIPNSSWYKFINCDITDITKSCEDILNYYNEYNDLSKNELIILNDLNRSDMVINPYNLDKSLDYSTYDTEPYNVKDVFYSIEAGLKNFEQSMTDEFKFANKIISESGLTLDMNSQYREKIEPITSMERYSTPEATYSRSVPFMICKELMSMPDNLKVIMTLAKDTYNHAIEIRDRITNNPDKEIKDDFVNESLRSFMSNFIESYKNLTATIYDAFLDRINALNRHLNGLNLSDRVDSTAYFGVEESYDDLNSDLNLISFEDTIDTQMEEYRVEERRAAMHVLEQYMYNVRGDIYTEEENKTTENETEKSEAPSESQNSESAKPANEPEKTESESKPEEKKDGTEKQDTETQNKDEQSQSDTNKKDENEDGKKSDESAKDNNETKESFIKRLIDRIKKALLNYLNKMRDKLDQEFTSEEFVTKLNSVLNDDSINHLTELSEARYGTRILKTAVQGYVGPMFGSGNKSVNGKSYDELKTAVNNFDNNFKNIDASVIMNASEENYRKVILEQFFHKTLTMSNVTIPDNIRSDVPMSEVTEFIKERIYETWSYGGLSKQEGGSDNVIGTGPETGAPKKKFVTEEVIRYLKYCQASGSESPSGWLPEKATLENTLNKLEQAFGKSYENADNTNDQNSSNNNGEKTEEEKKKDEEKKKQEELVRKKLEFCGTCFNTAAQAFKDCIISRARDYINVLNRLVPDDIRTKHGGKAEGVTDDKEEDNKTEENNSNENNSDNGKDSNNDNSSSESSSQDNQK